MSRSTDILFTPFAHGALKLKNRIVMAPMTRSFSPGGVPGADVEAYYRRRAENDVGLILSEGVAPNTVTALGTPRVSSRRCLSACSRAHRFTKPQRTKPEGDPWTSPCPRK